MRDKRVVGDFRFTGGAATWPILAACAPPQARRLPQVARPPQQRQSTIRCKVGAHGRMAGKNEKL